MSTLSELANLRKEMGLSQESMARKMGVTLSYYARIERGEVQAAAGFIRRLLRVCPKVNVDMFFKEEKRA